MPLSAVISLSLDHLFAFETVNHIHLESGTLDFSFINLGSFFFCCQDGFLDFLGIFESFELVLAMGDFLQVVLDQSSLLRQPVRQGGRRLERAHEVVCLVDLSLFSLQ